LARITSLSNREFKSLRVISSRELYTGYINNSRRLFIIIWGKELSSIDNVHGSQDHKSDINITIIWGNKIDSNKYSEYVTYD
jgi:hypothetical protein